LAPTLFVSDLHLCPSRPDVARRFELFLTETAASASALYILGDLFEYWIGDDDVDEPFNAAICARLRRLVEGGTAVHLMHGNRDFLIGDAFAARTGVRLLTDLERLNLAGVPTLLLHGDTLCVDDRAYQDFRIMVRSETWQRRFLAQPLSERRSQVEELRRQSEKEKSKKPMMLMDVNQDAVLRLLREQNHPPRLIHGHTHRPACHEFSVDGHPCQRWVLAAWEEQPSYLAIDQGGCRSVWLDPAP
jgi:UDP-2,3-diacylglucosamine hydrolase